MSTIEDDPKVFQGTPNEDARLENLGYEQGQFVEVIISLVITKQVANTLLQSSRDLLVS
jgi:hypothetical protein